MSTEFQVEDFITIVRPDISFQARPLQSNSRSQDTTWNALSNVDQFTVRLVVVKQRKKVVSSYLQDPYNIGYCDFLHDYIFNLGRWGGTNLAIGWVCHQCIIVADILYPSHWLVCIALKYRRYPSASRIILIRNGTSFGLIFRLGLIFLFSILSIGLVSTNLLLNQSVLSRDSIIPSFHSDRLAIISMFHMVNESWFRIELTTSAREWFTKPVSNLNDVSSYCSPRGGGNTFWYPTGEYFTCALFASSSRICSFWPQDILRVLMFWRKPSVAPILPVTSRESEIIIISSTESQPQNINDVRKSIYRHPTNHNILIFCPPSPSKIVNANHACVVSCLVHTKSVKFKLSNCSCIM